MSNEQGIRDELVHILDGDPLFGRIGYKHAESLANTLLASPAIRRIQAEAWDAGFDEASDDLGRAQMMRDLGESNNPYLEETT